MSDNFELRETFTGRNQVIAATDPTKVVQALPLHKCQDGPRMFCETTVGRLLLLPVQLGAGALMATWYLLPLFATAAFGMLALYLFGGAQ